MDKSLNVLHLEDDPDFAELVEAMLEDEGIRTTSVVVSDLPSFSTALEQESFDIILADYSLPSCNGAQALEVARTKSPHVPFLIVSGTVGEDAAIESLKRGATDYVLKAWLDRLVPAVRRAVQEAQEHTRREDAESTLTCRERYFQTLTENSLDVLTILTGDGKFRYSSPSLKHVLGYEPEELVGQSVFSLVHPDDLQGARGAFEKALTEPDSRFTHELRCRRRDSSWCYLEVVGQNRLTDPQMGGVVLNARDITARKQAESALIESERRFSVFMDYLPVAALIKDGGGHLVFANRYLQDLLCLRDWKGKTFSELLSAEVAARMSEADSKAMAGGLTVLQEKITDGEGKERTLETYRFPIMVQDEQRLLGALAIDVTERRELEAQLRQAQKMDAIGKLAGGVAHDFNNLLTVIRGNADLALMDQSQMGDQVCQCLKQVTAAADRSANLVRQLLTFSRKQVMRAEPHNLNQIIAQMTKMLVRIIGEHYQLQCAYHPSLPLIQADVGMMEQVLVNLVVNARDAMPKGGQLEIATTQVDIDEDFVHWHPEARVGRFVCLKITDAGTGISPEHLSHVFEPFFTTKQAGQGTGLGLATVYGIVKQHQGWIDVASRLGAGTTFSIFLPAFAGSVSANPAALLETPAQRGCEGILVVEDDAPVRILTRQILENGGYRVWEAACAQEAMAIAREHGRKVRLMLTDIVMPGGINGLELAEKMRAENPHLKVLLMSGYSVEVMRGAQGSQPWSEVAFLDKPYQPAALLRAVRRCLDENAPPLPEFTRAPNEGDL